MPLEIRVLAWDRHKTVAGLNRFTHYLGGFSNSLLFLFFLFYIYLRLFILLSSFFSIYFVVFVYLLRPIFHNVGM
jgi:small-conductance mechanosensitive channel